jgi:hypothetical protein
MAPRGTDAGAKGSYKIAKRKRSDGDGAAEPAAQPPATPPAQALVRASMVMAPRKKRKADEASTDGGQLGAVPTRQADAAAGGAEAARLIQSAGNELMLKAVAHKTFGAKRRAHDAGSGAAVSGANATIAAQTNQDGDGARRDAHVAAFVAQCCSDAAHNLTQNVSMLDRIGDDDAPADPHGSMMGQRLWPRAAPQLAQRRRETSGGSEAGLNNVAALAYAPVPSTPTQGVDGGGDVSGGEQQAEQRVGGQPAQHVRDGQARVESEEASAMRRAVEMRTEDAQCAHMDDAKSAPAWHIDTLGEPSASEERGDASEDERAAQRAAECSEASDSESEELELGAVDVPGPPSPGLASVAANASGVRAAAALRSPAEAEQPRVELVLEPAEADEPDELVLRPASVDGRVQSSFAFEQAETRDAPAASELSARLDASDRHAQRTVKTGICLELGSEADSDEHAENAREKRRAALEQRQREIADATFASAAGNEIDAEFAGVDKLANASRGALAREIARMMPPEWKANVCKPSENAASRALKQNRRAASARRQLKQLSVGQLRNARRALGWHILFCSMEDIPVYPVPADVLLCALEDYDLEAQERALERVEKGGDERKLGKTAVAAVRLGYLTFETHLGLDVEASDPMVKAMAKAGCGAPPKVARMTPLDGLEAFEYESRAHASEFVRAYAGAAYLGVTGSTRVIDQQRTASLHFERHMFGSESITVACGTATRSKGPSQAKMQALAWRAPLVNVQEGAGVNLTAMLNAMPRSADGCMYRGFEVPPGEERVITNAIAWSDKPAPHDVVVKSKQAILAPHIGVQRAALVGGHDQRHTVPEVARALGLARSEREAIGYWRSKVVVADDERDKAALARAVAAARQTRTRASGMAYNSDRYSSVDGARVESDTARITCLKMIAKVLREQAGSLPESSKDQVNLCRNAV